jgi:hypothetical protein
MILLERRRSWKELELKQKKCDIIWQRTGIKCLETRADLLELVYQELRSTGFCPERSHITCPVKHVVADAAQFQVTLHQHIAGLHYYTIQEHPRRLEAGGSVATISVIIAVIIAVIGLLYCADYLVKRPSAINFYRMY